MSKNETILIIDDIEENIDILERQLASAEFNVLTANEGPKGLHILKKEHVDLILLDINMPIIDGITLLSNIKEDELLSHIPVIMVTTKDQETAKVWAMPQGAKDYIVKPVQEKALIEHVNMVLSASINVVGNSYS